MAEIGIICIQRLGTRANQSMNPKLERHDEGRAKDAQFSV